ncbi:hypothetical protein [Halorubrum trueperi]|uniref:HMA domain-containing protein n=1 Tax=Halorubrum trueperi TaxID=2004704 RepID=A0ABD5UT74_9EURY
MSDDLSNDHRERPTPLDAAARDRGIDIDRVKRPGERSGERPASNSGDGPRVARVPEPHVHDTFAVEGIDTERREALLEAVLRDHDGVSSASATRRNGTVGIHHDPSLSRSALRESLESCGLIVAPGDEAFEVRRASQFASARVAVAVLFGLMVATPYIGVLYPTRVQWLFYDPMTVAYLQSILDSRVATHFFVNLAALSGIAFLVACGPTIRRAIDAVTEGRITNDAIFVGAVVAVFGYSTLAAFTGFDGAVHYDLVAYAVAGVTLWNHFGVEDPIATGTGRNESADDSVGGRNASPDPAAPTDGEPIAMADDESVAMTDGGR